MGNGIRILLNADGIVIDWVKRHFKSVSSSLSAIVNPRVAFGLLTLVNDSHHGFSVQQGVQKLKQCGLEFLGTTGSQTAPKEPGLTGLPSMTAFRLSAVDVFQYVLDYRDLMPGLDHGFAITFNPAGQRLELQAGRPDGSQEICYQSGMSTIVNKWYVACGVISPDRNHKLALSDDIAIVANPAGYLANMVDSPLVLGVSAAGSSILKGDMGFFGAWGNEFAMGDIVTATILGTNTIIGRGQAV